MKSWTIKSALSHGWMRTKENIWFSLAFLLIVYIVSYLLEESLIGWLVSVFTGYLMVSVFLRISRGIKVDFTTLFVDFSGTKFLQYFLLMVVVSVFVVVGLVAFLVPGIIVAIMTSLSSFILMDEKNDVAWNSKAFWHAITESKRLTSGEKWDLLVFFAVVLAMNVLGALAFGVGLLITVPVTCIALAHIYDALKRKPVEAVAAPAGNEATSHPSEPVSTTN